MKNTINIKLTQIYLETARSFIKSSVRSREMEELLNDEEFTHDKSTFIFGLATVSTVYSYMAIESFINNRLYELWKHSRLANKSAEQVKKENPTQAFNPIYEEFYKVYGKIDNFKDLRKTKLSELKERIKILCKEFKYPQIYDEDPVLWSEFTIMLENVRHFIIHPIPDENEFHKISNTLINEPEIFIKYPEVAQKIISHFYIYGKKEIPKYLAKNEIFMINEIVLLK